MLHLLPCVLCAKPNLRSSFAPLLPCVLCAKPNLRTSFAPLLLCVLCAKPKPSHLLCAFAPLRALRETKPSRFLCAFAPLRALRETNPTILQNPPHPFPQQQHTWRFSFFKTAIHVVYLQCLRTIYRCPLQQIFHRNKRKMFF